MSDIKYAGTISSSEHDRIEELILENHKLKDDLQIRINQLKLCIARESALTYLIFKHRIADADLIYELSNEFIKRLFD